MWLHRVQSQNKEETQGSAEGQDADSLRAHTSQETDSGVDAIKDQAPK